MQDTPEQSADLKMALKHDPATPELRAAMDSLEGDESYAECVAGLDAATPGSVIAELLTR
jgi:hypothetical protein